MHLAKKEMAAVLGVSLHDLGRYLERWPDFPVVKRGGMGREWAFDGEAVRAFLAEKEAAARLAADERRAAMAQLTLPLPGASGMLDPLAKATLADAVATTLDRLTGRLREVFRNQAAAGAISAEVASQLAGELGQAERGFIAALRAAGLTIERGAVAEAA
jgi:phage terminase Nu1 subunit (DNA packaging protein)